jgi:KUP system potassium uptake protein
MSSTFNSSKSSTSKLTLAALGVVYGDIGTSPLYAFREAFASGHGLAVTEMNVLATLSALFWAVMLIVTVKYIWVVLRFDNEGEGGVLALTALASRTIQQKSILTSLVIIAGVFGAALFYGDAMITPAISVLSAIEGISVATPHLEHWVVSITIGILIALFVVQKKGTGTVGKTFGPITILWFLVLAILGGYSIFQTPVVLQALNPLYAIQFIVQHPAAAFILMSAVFLAITGGEALYADMGHFGPKPVRLAWCFLVFPALMLNYFGQGALVLRSAEAVSNPFYFLAPGWFLFPLVALATAATVIASQATITGAYSMTLQAVRLGYLPRMQILHTSDTERGQIYIPAINWIMLIAVVVLVFQFKSSGAMAAAYGIAVSGTMIITTILALIVALSVKGRIRMIYFMILPVFLLLEIIFFSSNMMKVFSGGWMPLLVGLFIFTLLITWKRGSKVVSNARKSIDIPMNSFIFNNFSDIPRVPGAAVYLTSDLSLVPSALFHNLKHFKVMHEKTIFLHVITEDIPRVPVDDRLIIEKLAEHVFSVKVRFGFREEPDISNVLSGLVVDGAKPDAMMTTYFVARSTVIDQGAVMPHWQMALFGWMNRQAEGVAAYSNLPPNRVVELGTQIKL